jgi:hypothetical protein
VVIDAGHPRNATTVVPSLIRDRNAIRLCSARRLSKKLTENISLGTNRMRR